MNTRRNALRRLEQEIDNAGAPPDGDQVPHIYKDKNDDQAMVDPPLMDGPIRASLFQMSYAINTQAQSATTHDQTITSQTNQ